METAGKLAVVSGGGSGIGRAAVLALVNRASTVVVADINEDTGRQTEMVSVGIVCNSGGFNPSNGRRAPGRINMKRTPASPVDTLSPLGDEVPAGDPAEAARSRIVASSF